MSGRWSRIASAIAGMRREPPPWRRFQVNSLSNTQGGVNFTGPAVPAEPNETGWKETVMMFPGTVTRIIMRFDLPSVPFVVPPSPRTGGNEYVWHCHILEHEEHDMMRPLVVL